MKRFSFVTLATNEQYCIGAAVLASSLRRAQTYYEISVLKTPNLSEAYCHFLSKYFDNVIDVIPTKFGNETLNKIDCWNLLQFEKGIFIDADTVVLHNIDELFEMDELSAVPDPRWPDLFNTGLFVFQPNRATYLNLLKMAVEQSHSSDGAHDLLNRYFSDWLSKGISHRLSYIYNCVCPITDQCRMDFYTTLPAWVRFGGAVRVAHFAGPTKPWHRVSDARTCSEESYMAMLYNRPDRNMISRTAGMLAYWWSVFLLTVRSELTHNMYLGDFYLETKPSVQEQPIVNEFHPYQPTFECQMQREKCVRPPTPRNASSYHPEFHETRWDYLHHNQRVDKDNRFPEQHITPKPMDYQHVHHDRDRIQDVPPPTSFNNAGHDSSQQQCLPSMDWANLRFSAPDATHHEPKCNEQPQTINPPSKHVDEFPAANIATEQQFSPEKHEPESNANSFPLSCVKCRHELQQRKSPNKVQTHKLTNKDAPIKCATNKRRKSEKWVARKFEISTQTSYNKKSKKPLQSSRDEKIDFGSLRDKRSPIQRQNSTLTMKLERQIRHSLVGLCDDMDKTRRIKSYFSTSLRDALDLANDDITKRKRTKMKSMHTPPASRMDAEETPLVSNFYQTNQSEYNMNNTFTINSSPEETTLRVIKERRFSKRSSVSSESSQVFANTMYIDAANSGLILSKSKRKTSAELRRHREKLKERGFDKYVAEAKWENKAEIDAMRKILESIHPKKARARDQNSMLVPDRVCARHERLETERMYAWERGQIDYTGKDRFANILAKLCDTLSKAGGEENLPVGLDIEQ